MWLKCFVLLLVLGALASAQGKSCKGKTTRLEILSGDFSGLKRTHTVTAKVYHPNQEKDWSVTKGLYGKRPRWNHVLDFKKGSPFYKLSFLLTKGREFRMCKVKANAGVKRCRKIIKRGRKRPLIVYIKFAISC